MSLCLEISFLTINRINEMSFYVCFKHFVIICWVRINQRVGHELTESTYETSKPAYESSGYERSMGTKRLDTMYLHICSS